MKEKYPSPLPSPSSSAEYHFLEGSLPEVRSMSISSIHDEMNDIINMVSRIIVNYIKLGQRKPANQASQAFNESQFLRKKWMNSIFSHPCDLMPLFEYTQVELFPDTNFPQYPLVAEFIKPSFDKLGIQNECLVMTLIYIERILSEGEVSLSKENWRTIVYTSLLLAGKMLEDLNITNTDFVSVYPFFSLSSTNFLEKQLGSALGWRLFISPEQYSGYLQKLQTMINKEDAPLIKKLTRKGTLREEKLEI
jgi:hypothetical protein